MKRKRLIMLVAYLMAAALSFTACQEEEEGFDGTINNAWKLESCRYFIDPANEYLDVPFDEFHKALTRFKVWQFNSRDGSVALIREVQENRFKPDDRLIGRFVIEGGVYLSVDNRKEGRIEITNDGRLIIRTSSTEEIDSIYKDARSIVLSAMDMPEEEKKNVLTALDRERGNIERRHLTIVRTFSYMEEPPIEAN